MSDTYFTHEQPIIEALQSIDGLLVRTAADADEALNMAAFQPTAVVVFDADQVLQANSRAVLVKRGVSVHLFIAGATTERQPEDGQLVHSVFQALHGLSLPGYSEDLLFDGSDSQLVENIREYRLSLMTQTTLRAR